MEIMIHINKIDSMRSCSKLFQSLKRLSLFFFPAEIKITMQVSFLVYILTFNSNGYVAYYWRRYKMKVSIVIISLHSLKKCQITIHVFTHVSLHLLFSFSEWILGSYFCGIAQTGLWGHCQYLCTCLSYLWPLLPPLG